MQLEKCPGSDSDVLPAPQQDATFSSHFCAWLEGSIHLVISQNVQFQLSAHIWCFLSPHAYFIVQSDLFLVMPSGGSRDISQILFLDHYLVQSPDPWIPNIRSTYASVKTLYHFYLRLLIFSVRQSVSLCLSPLNNRRELYFSLLCLWENISFFGLLLFLKKKDFKKK